MHFGLRINWIVLVVKLSVVIVYIKAELLSDLPSPAALKEKLADSVCKILITDSPLAMRDCIKNFLSDHDETDIEPPSVEIRCRSDKTLTVSVPPSKEWQIVVIVDEEKSSKSHPYFVLMEPAKEVGEILEPEGSYTIWTGVLSSDGRHSLWKQGHIQPVDTLPVIEDKTYIIELRFLYDRYKNGSSDITAEFTWNSTDPTDSSFQVLNRCESNVMGNIFSKTVTPDLNRTVVIQDLPLDTACTVSVIGKYGRTDFTYDTPSCYDLPECRPQPHNIENITLDVLEDGIDVWTVRVRWRQPDHPPAYYTVTLTADEVYSINVTGSTSEVTFIDVHGDGLYYVTVAAFTSAGKVRNTVRDIFPPHKQAASVSIVVAAWAAALLVSLAAVLAFVLWKRQRDIKKRNMYFPGLRDKIAKEEAEACSAESGSEEQWEVRPERLQLHEVIGEGAFGVVRRGTLAPDNKEVAVKMLKDFPSVEEIRSFRAEMELMQSVGAHPHVVSLVGCSRARRPFIVAEYCARGDLLSYLRCSWDLMVTKRNAKYYNNNKEFDYRDDIKCKRDTRLVINRLYDLQGVCDSELTMLDLLSFCRQIAMGMEFLSSNRVVHRDLAARNILVTADKTLKIADFGLSRDIYQENQYKQKGNGKMPIKWMALESLTHRIYTTQSDVWSFGVVVWEVATLGGAPYPALGGARLPRLLRAGYRMPRPRACPPPLYELMLACWHERPRSRPTFSELHARLDELLCASARHYLDLRPDPRADPRPDPRHDPRYDLCHDRHDRHDPQRYVQMLIRGKWPWSRRGYHQPTTGNDYSSRTDCKLTDSLQTE